MLIGKTKKAHTTQGWSFWEQKRRKDEKKEQKKLKSTEEKERKMRIEEKKGAEKKIEEKEVKIDYVLLVKQTDKHKHTSKKRSHKCFY